MQGLLLPHDTPEAEHYPVMTALTFIQQPLVPDSASSKRQRRVVRSTAARAGHAESRRVKSIRHQTHKTRPGGSESVARTSRLNEVVPLATAEMLSSSRKDPFASFARLFETTEHFLLDHYVTAVVPLMRCNEASVQYMDRMTRTWVPLALSDVDLLNALFLAACRHLAASHNQEQQKEHYARLAVQYKLACMRSVMDAISANGSFRDVTIAETVMLAYDELTIGHADISRHHIDGAVRMVELNGGPQTLGLDGFLKQIIINLLSKFQGGVYKPPKPCLARSQEITN